MTAASRENTTTILPGIEALRALAALAVVAYHTAGIIDARPGGYSPAVLQNGAAGLDIFFVISGFVMVLSARRLAGQGDPARRFMRARLRRIVPLYWLCSGLKLAAMLAVPSARNAVSPGYCIASLLFLPVHDAGGRFKPVLSVGWTLSFEMMFYALFAMALAARRSPARWVPPVLAAIAMLPHTGDAASELANPIILEFAFGTTLASLWLHGWRLPAWLAWPVLLIAAALLTGTPKLALGTRVLSWGCPAACLVAATVSLHRTPGPAIPRFWLELGAASYAIYLTHGFVLAALGRGLATMPVGAYPAAAILGLALPGCAACGWLVHAVIETRFLLAAHRPDAGKPLAPAVLVLAGGGLSPLSGGVGTLMRNLMESWAQSDAAPCIRLLDTRGQGCAATSTVRFAYSLWLTAWLCASGRVHLVHAHMTTRGSAARKTLLCGLAMIIGVPVIVHMHGADFMAFHRGLHPALRWPLDAMLRRARHVVVLGVHWRRFLVREAGLDPARISIVPNGVPHSAGGAGAPSVTPGEAPGQLLFLGRLCARKGVPELISALAVPALREKPWYATLAGDGNAAPYRAMLAWHGLQDRVALPGWAGREKTQALLAQADILILPSHDEVLPLAVLEALAAGVAVITTPVGVIPEFLEDGTSALLVTPGQPAELSAAILRLLDDPALRARVAHGGHAVFRQRLEIGGVAARIADLYRQASAPAPATEAAE